MPGLSVDEDAWPDDQCVDADSEVWPEHDFPSVEKFDGGWIKHECRRCGAEPDDDED